MQDSSDYSASIITEGPQGTFYTSRSGKYPLDRLVRVSGVPFNIPKNATLGMLGVDPSPYSEEIEEIEGNPKHFNLVIRASQNMLTNGDVIHMPSWQRKELMEELDFFSLPPLPKLPTLHNIIDIIDAMMDQNHDSKEWPPWMMGILEEGFVVSFHRKRTRYRRSEEVRISWPSFDIDIRKIYPGYPGYRKLPPETIDQEIDRIDRIRVSTKDNPQLHHPGSNTSPDHPAIRIFNELFNEMFRDRIYVSDDAFLKLHSSSNYAAEVELKIHFGERGEDQTWRRGDHITPAYKRLKRLKHTSDPSDPSWCGCCYPG